MGRNYYDSECKDCGTVFVTLIGEPIECPSCGKIETVGPMKLEFEGKGKETPTTVPTPEIAREKETS